MCARSDCFTSSVETKHRQLAYSRAMATRSTKPEVFTFERIPAQTAAPSYAPIRPRRRAIRVMYPAKVRMYLPPAERSPAKRWLLALCLVVLWQIYSEEPCGDAPEGGAQSPAADCQLLSFQSAEEKVRQLTDGGAPEGVQVSPPTCDDKSRGDETASWGQVLLNATAAAAGPGLEAEVSRMYQESTRNSYMVALLVYHRLGSDN
ncbi:radiation-inducible immediate-early gene IEX-1 [Lampris incognitus]|uniref:radiation-inducible immediate-early gene IEX-1 n=1 Tax=Lampris incognitus TaxID=2546036 RepID=UPI0024B53855|nr:radiation-inducible immediate-early gene IEX-1 [Lampris incognitus]